MTTDFLTAFLNSSTRARIVRAFIFSPAESFTAAIAAKRVGIPVKAAAEEIRALEQMGVIKRGRVAITLANGSKRKVEGKQKEQTWVLNQDFKHFRSFISFINDVSPVQYEQFLKTLKRSGKMAVVILSGTFMGDASRPADLLVAADSLNERRLEQAIRTLEPQLGREIRYAAFSTPEFRYRLTIQDRLIRDTVDYPHLVLLDRMGLL